MATLFADRDKQMFESLQTHHMHAEEWASSITKIAHYAQDSGGTMAEDGPGREVPGENDDRDRSP